MRNLPGPLHLFSCHEMGLPLSALRKSMQRTYPSLTVDAPLLAQRRTELLRQALDPAAVASTPSSVWSSLYAGDDNSDAIRGWLRQVPPDLYLQWSALRPTRHRCASRYLLESSRRWQAMRLPPAPFEQPLALKANDGFDARLLPRCFSELPAALFDDTLRILLGFACNKVLEARPDACALEITVHHTVVEAFPGAVATNAPEGIHQDGMDFIVSALVVERRNVRGGISSIYGPDRTTKIVTCELQAGFGIFQPDTGSDLWHDVSPIEPLDPGSRAYRSSIGLDIEVRA